MVDLRRFSFGGPAGIVTSMALIVGCISAASPKATLVGSLLIVAVADNLTDSLSMHIYQEAERLSARQAFGTTIANFVTRVIISASFIALIVSLSEDAAIYASIVWGFVLLGVLSSLLAQRCGTKPLAEVLKHCGVAVVVIAISWQIGLWIPLLLAGR